MRRNAILLAALPFTNALSLANFQDITSVLIPSTCLLTYDQQIPKCKVADFEEPGCSAACEAQLTKLATAVIFACSNVIVNSNTLLGIIKAGNILEALCPPSDDGPTRTALPPKSTAAPQSSAVVVTSATKSSGLQTSTSTREAQSVTGTTSATRTTSSAVEPVTRPTDTPTPEPTPSPLSTDTGPANGGAASRSGTTSAAASATTTTAVKNKSSGLDTGGGSPFDISSNDAPHMSRSPILAIIIALGAGVLIAR